MTGGETAAANGARQRPQVPVSWLESAALQVARRLLRARNVSLPSVLVPVRQGGSYLDLALACLHRGILEPEWSPLLIYGVDAVESVESMRFSGAEHLQPRATSGRHGGEGAVAAAMSRAVGFVTRGPVIFLSDDRLPAPRILVHHLLCQAARPCIAIGNSGMSLRTHIEPEEAEGCGPPLPLFRPEEMEPFERLLRWAVPGPPLPAFEGCGGALGPAAWILFDSGNCSFPAEALAGEDAFDPRFEGTWLSDYDLGLRLRRSGLPFVFAENAVAIRQTGSPAPYPSAATPRQLGAFLAKHPELSEAEKRLVTRPPNSWTGPPRRAPRQSGRAGR